MGGGSEPRPQQPTWLGAAGLPDAAAGPPARRASDVEREQVVAQLHAAAADGRIEIDELEARTHGAYAARFTEDLERLTADLGPADPHRALSAAAPHRLPVRRDDGSASSWVVSVMGGAERGGRWRVAERCTVVDVMGGSTLDLNDAELSAQRTTIRVFSLMGGSEIRVPEGLNVEISEVAIMGGNDARVGEQLPDPGGPVVRIEMVSIMGGTSVRRGRKRTRAQKRADTAARRRELDGAESAGELDR